MCQAIYAVSPELKQEKREKNEKTKRKRNLFIKNP
jgi:hypothetical protein